MTGLLEIPGWLKIIPVLLSMGTGLVGAHIGNRWIVILGIPLGLIVGLLILAAVAKVKGDQSKEL